MYSPISWKNDIRWFYLTGTPELDLKNRYAVLEPIHRATVDPSFTKRIGQSMEIAVSGELQERADLYSTGHYIDLNEHPDDRPYSTDEPPWLQGRYGVANLTLQTLINTYPDSEYAGKADEVLMTRESHRAASLLPHLHSASIDEWITTLKALQFLNKRNGRVTSDPRYNHSWNPLF
jgi:hypothetical protein